MDYLTLLLYKPSAELTAVWVMIALV